MEEKQFMEERVDAQINWYSNRSSSNKKGFYILSIINTISALSIPFLLTIDTNNSITIKIIIGLLGVGIAFFSNLLTLLKVQEKWLKYRTTSETLKHEKYFYLTSSGVYKNEKDKFQLFVKRIERLISEENTEWNRLMFTKPIQKDNK